MLMDAQRFELAQLILVALEVKVGGSSRHPCFLVFDRKYPLATNNDDDDADDDGAGMLTAWVVIANTIYQQSPTFDCRGKVCLVGRLSYTFNLENLLTLLVFRYYCTSTS